MGDEPGSHRARILHIGPLPPPVGGVAVALQMIMQCPALQEFDHFVFNISTGQPAKIVGPKPITPRRIIHRLRLAFGLTTRVRCIQPDIVHFHMGTEGLFDTLGDFMLLGASRWAGSRLVLQLHVDPAGASLPGRGRVRQWLFRQLTRQVQMIFTLTAAYRAHLLSRGLHARVLVVPNMCDEKLLSMPVDRPVRPDGLRVIFVGRLTHAKGFFDLLNVAALLRDQYPQIHFEVAGLPNSSQDERRAHQLIEREALHKTVTRLGLVTGAAKLELFRRGDVLLCPSYAEALGVAAIEAMAAGLPVVASRVIGFETSVVHNETGYLLDPGNVAGMANSLTSLLLEPATRQQMGRAGRKRFLECFSTTQVGSILAQAYREVLGAV